MSIFCAGQELFVWKHAYSKAFSPKISRTISSRQSSQKEAISDLTGKNDQIKCQGITNAFESEVSLFKTHQSIKSL